MNQLDFFLNREERLIFIDYCFEQGCSIIPNQHYRTNAVIQVSDLVKYKKYCEDCPLLSISSKEFSTYPLELDFFEDDEKAKIFYIKQRHGGPIIDFFSPIVGEIENKIVGPGYLGIYPFYYHERQKFVPKKSLIEFYKLFSLFIKKMCRNVGLTQRTFWVGNLTIEKARKGEISLLPISDVNILTLI